MKNNNFSRSVLNDSVYNEKIVANKQYNNFWEAMFSRGSETDIHVVGQKINKATAYNLPLSQWYLVHETPEVEQWGTEYCATESENSVLEIIIEGLLGKNVWKILQRLSEEREIILECYKTFRGIICTRILDSNYNPIFNNKKSLWMNNVRDWKYLDITA